MTTYVSSGPDLFYETITRRKRGRAARTGRDRLRPGLENGHLIGGTPEPDVDEFIRGIASCTSATPTTASSTSWSTG
jgi:hypothetical protein